LREEIERRELIITFGYNNLKYLRVIIKDLRVITKNATLALLKKTARSQQKIYLRVHSKNATEW